MTTEQLIGLAAASILFLLGIVGWFVRKLVQDLETKVKGFSEEVKELTGTFTNWRVTVEQNFVSFDTYQNLSNRFTVNFENLFKSQSAHGEILARLDERSKGDDRLAAILTVIQKGFEERGRRR